MTEEKMNCVPLTTDLLKELLEGQKQSPDKATDYLVSELRKTKALLEKLIPEVNTLENKLSQLRNDKVLAENRFQSLQYDLRNLWPEEPQRLEVIKE